MRTPIALALCALLAPTSARAADLFGGYSAYGLTNPGAHLGVELHLAEAERFTVFSTLGLEGYREAGAQAGGMLNLRYGTRWTAPFGAMVETGLGAAGEVYASTETTWTFEDGVASSAEALRVRPAFAPSVFLGAGYDLSRRTKAPLMLYARPTLIWRIPDRNLALRNAVDVQVGLTWRR
ncbi:MAG: hypothetical protein H6739_28970 [Alphaproteobacteria bacterium]|nr:hypothetical protein [Alphaproteobacteria bacterium]